MNSEYLSISWLRLFFNKTGLINRRLLLPTLLLVLFIQHDTRQLVVHVLADAFLQVSAFVAATLACYYGLTHRFGLRPFGALTRRHPLIELSLAAVLGVLPGCGGAIIVVTQFTRGSASFGAVVAVLTSTMGDAAFLLLAQQPISGILVMAISLVTGIITGWLVNALHRQPQSLMSAMMSQPAPQDSAFSLPVQAGISRLSQIFWQILLLPALLAALLLAMQWDINQLLALPAGTVEGVGAMAGFICILLWSLASRGNTYAALTSEDSKPHERDWQMKVALDTQFVTSWVVSAFLLFELMVFVFGVDLAALFSGWGANLVLLAVLVGLLPGCGPQIIVTSLYLQGVIPFSAQLANALSNDGDALFPAIALAPKAALLATFYSAIPALLVGYGYYWMMESNW